MDTGEVPQQLWCESLIDGFMDDGCAGERTLNRSLKKAGQRVKQDVAKKRRKKNLKSRSEIAFDPYLWGVRAETTVLQGGRDCD